MSPGWRQFVLDYTASVIKYGMAILLVIVIALLIG